MIEWYNHHGKRVAVMSDLKGKHRDHCLCYCCKNFKPGTDENCKIAQETYHHNLQYGLVTPIYECSEYTKP